MITVGTRKVYANYSVLIPIDETALIEMDVYDWKFSLLLRFDDAAPAKSLKVSSTPDGAELLFNKWDSTSGTNLKEPAKFARLKNGNHLVFLAAHQRTGNINKLDLQFMEVGADNE